MSEVWKSHLKPWLEELRSIYVYQLLEARELGDMRELQGTIKALDAIILSVENNPI